jgi:hypothetical protein
MEVGNAVRPTTSKRSIKSVGQTTRRVRNPFQETDDVIICIFDEQTLQGSLRIQGELLQDYHLWKTLDFHIRSLQD